MAYAPGPPLAEAKPSLVCLQLLVLLRAEALHGNFFLATLSRSAGQLGLFSAGGRQLNTTGIGNTTGTIRRA
jgi:hypothetical protein